MQTPYQIILQFSMINFLGAVSTAYLLQFLVISERHTYSISDHYLY